MSWVLSKYIYILSGPIWDHNYCEEVVEVVYVSGTCILYDLFLTGYIHIWIFLGGILVVVSLNQMRCLGILWILSQVTV